VIEELTNVIQTYAWGSHSALAELRGDSTPSATPEAELWMGAHPLAPSKLAGNGQSLLQAIEAAPRALLGAAVVSRYGPKLPFLLKLLAAGTPLSLQAHPSLEQAEQGFAADEAQGILLDAPNRNYKDRNHKPELICALGEFWALCGFRDAPSSLALFGELGVRALAPYLAKLERAPDESGIKSLFSSLMLAAPAEQAELARLTAAACHERLGSARFGAELGWAARLAELYPGDIGVVSALLLNLVRLGAGEAIYLPAGNLHAYLGGTGVELMASSDNVLRGGLTPKHVNAAELLRILDFRPLSVERLRPVVEGDEHVYRTPAEEFRLSYFDLSGAPSLEVDVQGPEIWLVLSGEITLTPGDGPPLTLDRSRSAFVAAASQRLRISGHGRVFRAKTGAAH
jgi:mannose-6-phosphate isomerase